MRLRGVAVVEGVLERRRGALRPLHRCCSRAARRGSRSGATGCRRRSCRRSSCRPSSACGPPRSRAPSRRRWRPSPACRCSRAPPRGRPRSRARGTKRTLSSTRRSCDAGERANTLGPAACPARPVGGRAGLGGGRHAAVLGGGEEAAIGPVEQVAAERGGLHAHALGARHGAPGVGVLQRVAAVRDRVAGGRPGRGRGQRSGERNVSSARAAPLPTTRPSYTRFAEPAPVAEVGSRRDQGDPDPRRHRDVRRLPHHRAAGDRHRRPRRAHPHAGREGAGARRGQVRRLLRGGGRDRRERDLRAARRDPDPRARDRAARPTPSSTWAGWAARSAPTTAPPRRSARCG